MKKRIVMVVNSTNYYGLEKVTLTIMKKLSKEYDFIYITKPGPIIKELKKQNLNYYIIPSMNTKYIKKMLTNLKPSLIHTHDYRASFICTCINPNIPIISHIHNNPTWLKRITPYSFLFLYSSLKSKKTLLVSQSISDDYIFSKLLKNKFIYVSNPLNKEEIVKNTSIIPYKKYDICCIARLVNQKNPYFFIKIIKNLKKKNPYIKSIWIGEGPLKDKFLKKIKLQHLENNIKYVGYQDNPYKYLSQSKIFVLTSKYEAFGLSAYEALSLGVPCIVPNTKELSRIINNTCGYLCNSKYDYIENITYLLYNKNILKKYSNNSIKQSINLENQKDYINKINQIYKEYI